MATHSSTLARRIPWTGEPGKLQAILQRIWHDWSDLSGRRHIYIYIYVKHLLAHRKSKSARKTSSSALLTIPKPLTVWITTNCVKFLKIWEYQKTLLASWETCMQVKKQQLELDMEGWTGFKSGKEYVEAIYCHPAYLTYMQNTSCETRGWMKHKLESKLPEEISITSDMQMTPPLW